MRWQEELSEWPTAVISSRLTAEFTTPLKTELGGGRGFGRGSRIEGCTVSCHVRCTLHSIIEITMSPLCSQVWRKWKEYRRETEKSEYISRRSGGIRGGGEGRGGGAVAGTFHCVNVGAFKKDLWKQLWHICLLVLRRQNERERFMSSKMDFPCLTYQEAARDVSFARASEFKIKIRGIRFVLVQRIIQGPACHTGTRHQLLSTYSVWKKNEHQPSPSGFITQDYSQLQTLRQLREALLDFIGFLHIAASAWYPHHWDSY